MNRKIVRYGEIVLQQKAREVKNITAAEAQLVADMVETMYKAPGVGLAAPQVGVSQRIMVTDTSGGEKENNLLVIVNPDTLVRWHRKGFRLYWTWKSRRRQGGRPAIDPDVCELIRVMSRNNIGWGASATARLASMVNCKCSVLKRCLQPHAHPGSRRMWSD